jgi:hypothetical protein
MSRSTLYRPVSDRPFISTRVLDGDLHRRQRMVPVHPDVTTTVPCMNGWMEQMYGYVPGLEKVWV